MMLRLLLDVMTNRFALRSTYGKGAITFLPCEMMHTNLIVYPAGRNRLQLTKHICQAVRRAQANQQMHVIRHTAHALGNSIRRPDDSAKICVQVSAPRRLDDRLMIFRSENDVIMQ